MKTEKPHYTPIQTVGLLLLLPVHAVASGLIVRYLYHRLIVPTFPSLPPHLSIAAALGLVIFVGYMTMDEASIANDERPLLDRETQWLASRALVLLLALVVGWFI